MRDGGRTDPVAAVTRIGVAMRSGCRKPPGLTGMEGYAVGVTCKGICARWVVGDGDGNPGMEGVADGIVTKSASGDEGCSGTMFSYSSCCETVLALGVKRSTRL